MDLVTFTVKVNGKEIADTIQVFSVDTWHMVNRVPRARLVILDGNAAEGDFKLSEGNTFLPGNRVEIAAGYSGQGESTIFNGVISKQGIRIGRELGSALVVDLIDPALKMTLSRKTAIFENIRDSDLISALITTNGLIPDVSETDTVHEQIVQFDATDWDLMLTRAGMNGLLVMTEAGKVTVRKPDTEQSPALTIVYGDNLLGLKAEMNAATQYASKAIKSSAWDPDKQVLMESGPGPVDIREQGSPSSEDLAEVFDVEKFSLQGGIETDKSILLDWASAMLLKSKLAKICGRVQIIGNALAETGKIIVFGGLGKRFNGTAFISGVHHRIKGGDWLTTATFGLSPKWFASRPRHISSPGDSEQLPPVKGLQTGIVIKPPQKTGAGVRVLLNLPVAGAKSNVIWARVASLCACSQGDGDRLLAAGDEVVVGFMNQDPRHPIVLGRVHPAGC